MKGAAIQCTFYIVVLLNTPNLLWIKGNDKKGGSSFSRGNGGFKTLLRHIFLQKVGEVETLNRSKGFSQTTIAQHSDKNLSDLAHLQKHMLLPSTGHHY